MRIALISSIALVSLPCACRPAQSLRAADDCGLPLDADSDERIVTIAHASREPILTWQRTLGTKPIEARRVLPVTPTDLDENDMPVPAPPRADTAKWTRLVTITTEADPSRIDVWGRRCANDSASVRELRIGERVVHRAIVRDAELRRYLD